MKNKTIQIYKFEELKGDIQEKVLNRFREQNEYTFLEENLNEHLNEILIKNKIKTLRDLNLRYSLTCSQGDGVSFTGLFKWNNFLIKISLGRLSNHYTHSKTTDIEVFKNDEEETEADEKTEKNFKEVYFDICNELEKIGYSTIEEEDSNEFIKETIAENEYTFRSNGEIEYF